MTVQIRLARVTAGLSSPATIAATGFTDGDLILLEVRNQNGGVAVTAPAGFSLLYAVTGGGVQEVRLYAKIANGESGSYSVSWTGGGTARLGIVALYSDAGKTLQLDGHATQDNPSSSTNLPCPSITTTINGAMRVDFVGINNAVTTSAGSGQTKQYDTGGTSTVAAFTQTITTAGATGTRTPTGGSAQTSRVIVVAYAEMPAPDAPSDLEAEPITASRIDLAWTDNANNEDSFSVEQSPNGITGWTEIATPAANATSYSVTGLATNTSYWFRVRALNGGGYSSYSNIAHGLTLLATAPVSEPRLFLLNPDVVFAAQVVLLDPAEYPVSFVAYDNVTTGDYTDIEDGMTLLLGTAPGLDDLGCQRVRGTPTTISIFVGRSSRGIRDGELTLVDNAYITVLNEFLPWAKMSFIDADGRIFKDSIIEVGDNTTFPPPVANFGESYAATINDDGVISVFLPGELSFAVADGATITDYLWDIKDGTLLVGSSLTDAHIDVTFPAGYRYPSLTVTDSNGKSHTTRRLIVADDPDARISFDGFAIDSIRITDAGQTLSIRVLEDMPEATYRPRTQALIWDREPLGAANRDHMIMVGWLGTEESSVSAAKTGLLRDTTLTILDGAAKLDLLPGFPQSIADDATRDDSEDSKTPEITWNYGFNITLDWFIHYLLYWHSTAFEIMSFMWSGTGNTYRVITKSSDGESLWQQVKRVAKDMCPGYVLTCDRAGGIAVVADPMYQELDDRTDVVQATLSEDDFSDIRITRNPAPTTHWLKTGAILVQDGVSFNPDGSLYLPTVFSIAPGDTPGQGLGEVDDNEQLAASQDVLNKATGHRYASLNAPITSLVVTLIQDDSAPHAATPWREIEPALKHWVTLTLSAAYAAQRGLTFTATRCLPKEVNIRYNISKTATTRTVELTLTPETSGPPGATVIMPAIPAVGDEPAVIPDPIPPPDSGLIGGQDMVAAIGKFKVYRTADFTTDSGSGGPTWDAKDLTGSDEMLTWVVDPFSPGYIEGSGTIDGWAASATKLYRLADLFGAAPTATAVITFATTALWRTIQASFGTYFFEGDNPWLICVSYYGDAAGHTGTWAAYSLDGGITWSDEVLVSADYNSGGASNPIGLYCSPRTPGLAYTFAHIETANPATTGGFVSRDWGATWTLIVSEEDPGNPLPYLGTFSGEGTSLSSSPTVVWDENGVRTTGFGVSISLTETNPSPILKRDKVVIVAPPANTKQMTISGHFEVDINWSGFGSAGGSFSCTLNGATLSRTTISDTNNGASGNHSHYVRDFIYQFDFGNWATQDWPKNRDVAEAAGDSLAIADTSVRFLCELSSNAFATNDNTLALSIRVDEIVLDDGTTYGPVLPGTFVPINSQGGEIHVPWADNADEGIIYHGVLDIAGNRLFSAHRIEGADVWDATPTADDIFYGVNHGHFAIRAHDSDRNLVLLAGTGNDTSGSESDDKQGLWASTDGGDSWDEIIAPTTGTEPYSAAWSGSLDGVVYIWGPAGYMGYSTDSGATIDDRSGNLGALSATKIIGLAGGPTS